jgi:hypothetical protein
MSDGLLESAELQGRLDAKFADQYGTVGSSGPLPTVKRARGK